MADESTFEPELAEIEDLLRGLDSDQLTLDAPPADVWAAIEAELGSDLAAPASAHRGGSVVQGAFGRSRWAMPLLAAAAALVLVVAGVAITRTGSTATTVAVAELAYDPETFDPAGADAAASARLVDDDGTELIEIDDAALPFDQADDAKLELWLIQVDDSGIVDMVSLGDIPDDGDLTFAVPAGYDPAVYKVVDISIEPHDGDATHSGRSILRGSLESA